MSTDRPKRNIIKKKYDISDGMPWCEERLVRKVLFLSLREFRDTHRATHKNTHIHTCTNKRTQKNTILHAPQKTQTSTNTPSQKRQSVQLSQQKVTHRPVSTHTQRNQQVSKQLQPHEHNRKGHKNQLSQDAHTPKTANTPKNTHTQSHSVSQRTLTSTRTLRSHTSQTAPVLPNSTKHIPHTQHRHTVRNTETPLNKASPARTLRSQTPTNLKGIIINGISRHQSLLPASPTHIRSLQTRPGPPQRRPASIYRDKEDPASKRPRLQAQRKFAQSPPNSPGPPLLMTSPRINYISSQTLGTCLTRRRPKTEDFLSFLCLRGSAALPSNMAFLGSGRAKEPANNQHPTYSPSTNHRTVAQGKYTRLFSRSTVQRDSQHLRGSGRSAAVSSPCPLSARAERRRERKKREEEQQGRRSKGVEGTRRDIAERHLLRHRQPPLQVRRNNKVALTSGLCERRTTLVKSVPSSKPGTGTRSRGSTRTSKKPRHTCKPKGQPPSRPKESNHKHLSVQSSNQELPRNHHLPLHRRTVSNCHSKPKTPSILQNSGRNSSRPPAHTPLANGSVTRLQSENPGSLRVSRRKRGLPPDTRPAPPHPQGNYSSRKSRTTQYNHVHVPLETVEVLQKETGCNKVNGAEDTCQDKDPGKERSGHGEEVRLQTSNSTSEDQQVKGNVEKLSLESISSPKPSSTNGDPSPISKVTSRPIRETRIQKNQPASSAVTKPITRTTDSRARAAGTTFTKAAINSVTSTQPDPPATYSAKHSAKGTNKGTSKDITKCTSPASRYPIHYSKGAAKDSSKDTTGDATKDRSSTSKGSTKGLTETKSTTSAIKTRTSPRSLQKR
ncbi:protein Jumonji-like [Xyrichtys novacula]|uniref:Protein Jumonji-like n=1 Tax=Xyrichtys novacula TaxID=13765 RepID=A0AAV1FLB0_XYRNO|nr:protein Jumonji-like [Xyrichtys novacula]